jgi:hypothetical protein
MKELWLPDQKIWNAQLVDTIFQEPVASAIKQTPIIDYVEKD